LAVLGKIKSPGSALVGHYTPEEANSSREEVSCGVYLCLKKKGEAVRGQEEAQNQQAFTCRNSEKKGGCRKDIFFFILPSAFPFQGDGRAAVKEKSTPKKNLFLTDLPPWRKKVIVALLPPMSAGTGMFIVIIETKKPRSRLL